MDLAKMVNEEIVTFESNFEKIEATLLRLEDKILMTKCGVNEKIESFHDQVREKIQSHAN